MRGEHTNPIVSSMRHLQDELAWTLAGLLLLTAEAQVPQRINYQGGVAVGGAAYHGVGYFKFAFISPDASVTLWSNDGTSQGGAEPDEGISLVVYRGAYEVALGDPALPHMQPVPAEVFTHPDVHLRVWFSSDNQSYEPVEPDTPISAVGYALVAATVPDRAITSSKLAPNAVTALNLAPGSVGPAQLAANAAALNLRAGGGLVLSDQAAPSNLLAAGFTRLGQVQVESDQWSAFTPFTLTPRTAAVGVWTGRYFLVWGGKDATWFADGALYDPTAETWKPIASCPNPVPTGGAKGLWTGGELLVFGDVAGQHRRYSLAADEWRAISSEKAPNSVVSAGKVVVWTGREVLIWGGPTSGHRYDPDTDQWRLMSATNLARPTEGYTGVWTGSELVIWGSRNGAIAGLRYRPETDTWTTMSVAGAPKARLYHTLVCSGPEVIVWGGRTATTTTAPPLGTGGIYNLGNDTWRPMSTNGALARSQHVACWTGTEMLVWGGLVPDATQPGVGVQYPSEGARYNPKADSWQAISRQGLPGNLPGATILWTGKDLYVWGGGETYTGISQRPVSNAGWRYRPATDAWAPLACPPVGRSGGSAVWTGREFIIWGGSSNTVGMSYFGMNSGAKLNPATGRWYPVSTLNAPSPRWSHGAVWTGREMIVWGGEGLDANGRMSQNGTLNTGGRYDPLGDVWRPMDTNGAPSPRSGHSMTWTGTELLVFGGRTQRSDAWGRSVTNTGGRYQPQTDSWSTLAVSQAPSPRQSHAAAWTGTELIIWGGLGSSALNTPALLGSGARYNHVLNTWTTMAGLAAGATGVVASVWADPSFIVWNVNTGNGARYLPAADRWEPIATGGPRSVSASAAAVWTGSEMLVWGAPILNSGSRYNPRTDVWSPMTTVSAPKLAWTPPGAWAGDSLLLFGGTGVPTRSNVTFRYALTRPLYLFGGQ